ncbi:MAG TPA: DIP1984 family protein [Jiangellaceae bacterium]
MKLAEALARRSELTDRFGELQRRAAESARYQEGDAPAEDASELMAESDRVADELERLIRRINATNLATELAPGTSVTDALAQRDVLRLRRRFRADLADAAVTSTERWTRSEIKMVPAVDVRELRRQADAVAAELRALDTRLQEVNWTAELLE